MLERMLRKRHIYSLLVGMLTGTGTMENSTELPQNIENRITVQPSNFSSGYLLKNLWKHSFLKLYCTLHVYCSMVAKMATTEVPFNR